MHGASNNITLKEQATSFSSGLLVSQADSLGDLPTKVLHRKLEKEFLETYRGQLRGGEQEVRDFCSKGRKPSGGCFHLACDDKIRN